MPRLTWLGTLFIGVIAVAATRWSYCMGLTADTCLLVFLAACVAMSAVVGLGMEMAKREWYGAVLVVCLTPLGAFMLVCLYEAVEHPQKFAAWVDAGNPGPVAPITDAGDAQVRP